MNVLQLHIDADWPDGHADCPWRLFSASGELLQRGQGEPRHWPMVQDTAKGQAARMDVELLLSADQVLCLSAELPRGPQGRKPEVIAYAIEDRLVGDVELGHRVLGPTLGNGTTRILVIDKSRLRHILGSIAGLGLTPTRAIVAAEAHEADAEGWHVGHLGLDNQGSGWLRTPDSWLALSPVQSAQTVPPELLWAVSASAETPPRRLVVHAAAGTNCDTEAWGKALGCVVDLKAAGEQTGQRATNLLQGSFAPARRHRALGQLYRLPLGIAAVGLLLWTVTSLGDWLWLEWQTRQLRENIQQTFRATLPEVSTVIDPVRQLQRAIDDRRLQQGRVGEGDFLALLAALASTEPMSIEQLRHDGRQLAATLSYRDTAAFERARQLLASRGIQVTIPPGEARPGGGGNAPLRLSLELRPGVGS